MEERRRERREWEGRRRESGEGKEREEKASGGTAGKGRECEVKGMDECGLKQFAKQSDTDLAG